jgi:hypothetical protein
MVGLADGVTAGRGRRVWAPGPAGAPVDAAEATLEPGAAVVVGPDSTHPGHLSDALRRLKVLVAAGGVAAAGAGVDLGPAFGGAAEPSTERLRSARLAGASGDRRDAILAALRVLGVDGADRLGDRAAVMTALFGDSVTRPVGSAAASAVQGGRWSALHLASAASDLLGPEQLERVLALDEPQRAYGALWTDPPASVLSGHLERVLGPYKRPRRLALLLDLWNEVEIYHTDQRRRQRLRAVQGRQDRTEALSRRYRHFVDEQIAAQMRAQYGPDVTLGQAAQWIPPPWQWHRWFSWLLHDAIAATVLLRVAVAVAEQGLLDGVLARREQIAAAALLLDAADAGRASAPVAGMIGLPARPGVYLRDLDRRLRADGAIGHATAKFIQQRLARARDYGLVVAMAGSELFDAFADLERPLAAQGWSCSHLAQWRVAAGFSAGRPPASWEQPPLSGDRPALAQRLQEQPYVSPHEVEQPDDLLWSAELADALAQLHGHDHATVTYGQPAPRFDTDPHDLEPDALRPHADSVGHAMMGASHLISLGAEMSAEARRWRELIDGLLSATAVAEALTGAFPVPVPFAALDGRVLPGTDLRLQLARDAHAPAEWAQYMGNCISGPYYLDRARAGRCVLAALRDGEDRVVANIEFVPRGAGRPGWRVNELRARFNTDAGADLAARLMSWVAPVPSATAPSPAQRRTHQRGPHRPQRRRRRLKDLGDRLTDLAAAALSDAVTIDATTARCASPMLAVVTRRTPPVALDEAVRHSIAHETPDLARFWWLTSVRPMAAALAGLDDELRRRAGLVELLGTETPLPRGMRRLARLREVGEARTVDLIALRLRAALGRLVRAADPVLALAVGPHADPDLLCALVLAASAGPAIPAGELTPLTRRGDIEVPGFPPSTLDDEHGPWHRALTGAQELGADLHWRAPYPALVVPTSWLGPGGWPALWARAARRDVGQERPGTAPVAGAGARTEW